MFSCARCWLCRAFIFGYVLSLLRQQYGIGYSDNGSKTSSRKMYFKPFSFFYHLCHSLTNTHTDTQSHWRCLFPSLLWTHFFFYPTAFLVSSLTSRCSIWAIKTLTTINTANPTCKYAHQQICMYRKSLLFPTENTFFFKHGIVNDCFVREIECWKLVMCAHITIYTILVRRCCHPFLVHNTFHVTFNAHSHFMRACSRFRSV